MLLGLEILVSEDLKVAKEPAHVDLETKLDGPTECENARQAALGKISRHHQLTSCQLHWRCCHQTPPLDLHNCFHSELVRTKVQMLLCGKLKAVQAKWWR
jgi:hypothetical protein